MSSAFYSGFWFRSSSLPLGCVRLELWLHVHLDSPSLFYLYTLLYFVFIVERIKWMFCCIPLSTSHHIYFKTMCQVVHLSWYQLDVGFLKNGFLTWLITLKNEVPWTDFENLALLQVTLISLGPIIWFIFQAMRVMDDNYSCWWGWRGGHIIIVFLHFELLTSGVV